MELDLLLHEWRLAALREQAGRAGLAQQALRHSRGELVAAAVTRRRPRRGTGRVAARAEPCS